MTKWEYIWMWFIHGIEADSIQITEMLNRKGRQGWEVLFIGIYEDKTGCLMKRPMEDCCKQKEDDALKPCPHCGGAATIEETDGGERIVIKCKMCGCCTDFCFSYGCAMSLWNRRI